MTAPDPPAASTASPQAPVIGIDLGGTNMQVGVVSTTGQILGRAKKKTKAEKGKEAVLQRVADAAREALDDAGLTTADIAALGIGAPGAIDVRSGVILDAPNLRWSDVRLADELAALLDGLAVVVENDVNAAVWGENKLGAGGDAENILGVWVGTGVGGGLIIHGRIYHGASGTAGEIGHSLLFPNAPLTFRKLEDVCSRTAVVRRVVHLVETNHPSIISQLAEEKGRSIREIGSGTVARAFELGDEVVCDVINESADYLGRGIANAVTLLGLERVVLGGGLTEALGQPFVDVVARSAREHVFPKAVGDRLEIVATTLNDDAGLLGAALLAQERLAVLAQT